MVNGKDLMRELVDLLGVGEAEKVEYNFNLRFHDKHETDNVNQKEYLEQKDVCWRNYLRAYYSIPKDKRAERRYQRLVRENALKSRNPEPVLENQFLDVLGEAESESCVEKILRVWNDDLYELNNYRW